MEVSEVSLAAALTAGLLSFVSPCVLPLVPAYISYMTGVSVDSLRQAEEDGDLRMEWKALSHSLAFVAGFSMVFILLGASSSLLGRLMLSYIHILTKVGGVLIIVMGLHYSGLLRLTILNMDAHFTVKQRPTSLLGSFVIGLSFAFGWTPCVGPILAAILALAGMQEGVTQGVVLLATYSAGLGIPFILAGLAIHRFFAFFSRIRQYLHWIEVFSGILLIIIGVLIFLGDFNRFSSMLLEWFPGLARLG